VRIALAALVAAVAAAVIAAALALGESDKGAPAVSSTKRWLPLTQPDLARSEVGAARIGRFAYVVGGLEQNADSVTAAVERYDIRRDRWTQVRAMPLPLHHCVAAAHAGKLYVSGGYRADQALESTSRALFAIEGGAQPGRTFAKTIEYLDVR
jgi:Kelch motif protein